MLGLGFTLKAGVFGMGAQSLGIEPKAYSFATQLNALCQDNPLLCICRPMENGNWIV